MFNISPMELMLVFVVALLVIGPDKLPGAVRTGSLWLGRFRRSYNKVKSEIERELNTDEIKRQLHNEAVLEEIEQAKAGLAGEYPDRAAERLRQLPYQLAVRPVVLWRAPQGDLQAAVLH